MAICLEQGIEKWLTNLCVLVELNSACIRLNTELQAAFPANTKIVFHECMQGAPRVAF
jgi:hypothetical protein